MKGLAVKTKSQACMVSMTVKGERRWQKRKPPMLQGMELNGKNTAEAKTY
jgi:hypothetical protein